MRTSRRWSEWPVEPLAPVPRHASSGDRRACNPQRRGSPEPARSLIQRERPAENGWPAKILVVDDDANVQRLLQYTLKQEGYDVIVAADGAEGFRLWGAERPALILLDVALPKLDGYAVADARSGPRRAAGTTSRSSCSPPSVRSSRRSAACAPARTTT